METRRKLLYNLFKFSDSVILLFSLALTYYLIHLPAVFPFGQLLLFKVRILDVLVTSGLAYCWYLIYSACRLYTSRRFENWIREFLDILRAVSLGVLIVLVVDFVLHIFNLPLNFFITFWGVTIIITSGFRVLLRSFLKRVRRRGINLRNVIIVGTNAQAIDVAKKIKENQEMGYRFKGFIDTRSYGAQSGVILLGTPDDLPAILAHDVIDEIIIALPIKSHYEMMQKIVRNAEVQGVSVRHNYQLFETKTAKFITDEFNDFPCLTMTCWPYSEWQFAVKRAIDILVSGTLLIVISPILLLTAVLIKMSSNGPVFFIQRRVGFNKRTFSLLKFRSMVVDAEELQKKLEKDNEMDGAAFKIKNDPRITGIGQFIRKFSIDELPQLINILKGEMSLVGPRPLPIRDYKKFEKDWQRRRCSVLPGLTCTWQISGRNEISFEEWMKLDLEYIDNWTLRKDFHILLKTVPVVLIGKGSS
ncbi:sugar transferase [Thermodesulfobacteriota bacterium]